MSRTRCGSVGTTGRGGDALVPDELGVVVEPAPVAVRVELAHEQDRGRRRGGGARREQRLEGALLGDRQVGPIGVGGLDQDVEVADGAEAGGHLAQPAAMLLRPLGPERLAEDPPRGALAARRDAHPVEVLRIDPVAGPGLLGDHLARGGSGGPSGRPRRRGRRRGRRASCRRRGGAGRPRRGRSAAVDVGRRGRRLRPSPVGLRRAARGDVGATAAAGGLEAAAASRSVDAVAAHVAAAGVAIRPRGLGLVGRPLGGRLELGERPPRRSPRSAAAAATFGADWLIVERSTRRRAALRLRFGSAAATARERRLELGRVGRGEARVGRERPVDLGETRLVAAHQLDLELDEPADDPAPADGVDLVEAQLDRRAVALEDPLPAELADRDDLDERRVAALLEDQRAGIGRRPVARMGGPVGRALELLAAMDVAGPDAPNRRLDRDRRRLRRLAQPGGEPGPGHRPVGGVDVAILDLGRADRRRSGRKPAISSAAR